MRTTRSRPYAGEADLHALIHFLNEARTRNAVQRWHPGDLVWRMFYSSLFDPLENVRLWHDENDQLVGFVWLYPPNAADLYAADPALLPEMIAWAQAYAGDETLYLVTLDNSAAEIALLEAAGFTAETPYGVHLRQTLDRDFAAPLLPTGFTLRPLAGDHEVEARAVAHQQAFDSQMVTVEGYRNVTHAPLYERDLDLVVVAPDGEIVAFCLCWLDDVNKVGLFEPLGTKPAFQRRGLARAVMLEGLRRMQARGMHSALVASAADNAASRGLYAALGFTELESRELVYKREKAAIAE